MTYIWSLGMAEGKAKYLELDQKKNTKLWSTEYLEIEKDLMELEEFLKISNCGRIYKETKTCFN